MEIFVNPSDFFPNTNLKWLDNCCVLKFLRMDGKHLMQPPFQIHLTEGVEILVTLIGAHYNYMDHIAKRMQHFCLICTQSIFFLLRFGTFISPGVIILNMILTRQKRVSVDSLAMWSSFQFNITNFVTYVCVPHIVNLFLLIAPSCILQYILQQGCWTCATYAQPDSVAIFGIEMLSTLCWRRPICTILKNILLMCFLSAMLFSIILTLYLFYCTISLFHAFSMFSHVSSLRAKSFIRAVVYVSRKHTTPVQWLIRFRNLN